MRRWIPVLVLAVVLLLLAGTCLRFPEPRLAPTPAPAPSPKRVLPAFLPPLSVPEQPAPAPAPLEELPPTGPIARAHALAAEALGTVSIRCYVGSQLDSMEVFQGVEPRIEDGWYTAVVRTLQGSELVEGRERGTTADPEPLFDVRWSADSPGTTVPCDVVWLDYAHLDVTVVAPDGLPLEGVTVKGCGGRFEVSDANGVAQAAVPATERCVLSAVTVLDHAFHEGHVEVMELAQGENRVVTMQMVGDSELEEADAPEEIEDPLLLDPYAPPPELRERAARLRALLTEVSDAEAEVLVRIAERDEKRANDVDELNDLLDQMGLARPGGPQ